ncbi:MAG: MBL fold metallo-hydrolase [Flavobacteriales bacterium]|nr:MBL fold metallo-hydrolase [Flavobacteriales bacterium]
MIIKQFEDKNLAHYSYAILSKGEVALIDPARDPQPYYDFATENNAVIKSVIETHPHADFVSSHLEIHQTFKAEIYVSKLLGAEYEHKTFDDGDSMQLGNIQLKAINTPGHSPDSISIIAVDEEGQEKAVFTGDTLFIGDCGRPDLRENAGAITQTRENLAKQMYHSLRNKLMTLPEDVLVYPAHGAGSLCGKGLSEKNSSTIGEEKKSNWSLQNMDEEMFVKELLADQPFIPKYFTFNVFLNKKGAEPYLQSIKKVKKHEPIFSSDQVNGLDPNVLIIDTRSQNDFKNSYLKNSINLMKGTRFETWLGSIIEPKENFYLAADSETSLNEMIEKIAKIGYENQISLAFVLGHGSSSMKFFDSSELKKNEDAYTIIDIRNHSERKANAIFANAIHIPLHELRERTNEIPLDKSIVVHCEGGYRSAAGSSIIETNLNKSVQVYDLSEDVLNFKKSR